MSDALDQVVVTGMPSFIVSQYKRMLDASCAEDETRAALRVYELVLRILGFAVVSQYLMRDYDRISDYDLNQLLETKLSRATLNVWQRLFFLGLRTYGGHRDLLFVRELYDFYWDTSAEPHVPRIDIEVPFTRLTQICNDILLGARPEDEQGWQILCDETVGLLRQLLTGFAFFRNYELIRIVRHEGNQYWYESHKGVEPQVISEPLETERDLGEGWFYLSKERRDFLSMHPLLILWDEVVERADLAVYDRFIGHDRMLQYLTVTLWETIEDSTNVGDFISMLYTALEEKRVREKYRQLHWLKLREVAHTISEHQMAAVHGKYQAELYLQRNQTREAFQRFLDSDKVGFVLTGQSGVGKSNFVLALAEEFAGQRSSICLLMYDGGRLDPGRSLTAIVSEGFDREVQLGGREKIADIWQEIARVEDMDERKVVLVIDAINENPRAQELLKRIDELVVEINRPWLKVVVTSRPEAWRTIRRGVRLAEARYYREPGEGRLDVEMEPFSYYEMERFEGSVEMKRFTGGELPQAYDKYRKAFRLQTVYEDLPVGVRLALRDPLLLRLVADTYQGCEIPPTIKPTEIYRSYLVGLEETGRLLKEDMWFLTRDLMPLMIREGHYTNAITAGQISTATASDGRSLFHLIHNDGLLAGGRHVNQSYRNLADGGILVQRGMAQDYEVGFGYEHFYDYHGGIRLFELNADLEDKTAAYVEQIGLTQEKQYLWGPVKYALIQELLEGGRATILAICREDERGVREMMTAVLKEYGQENPSEVRAILAELMTRQTLPRRVWASLGGLVGKRRRHWEESTKRIAIDVAGTVGFPDVLAQGASDPSSSLRLEAIRQVFYLWCKDRRELPVTAENRGMSALQHLGGRTSGFLGLPKTIPMGSVSGISILMFLESPNDPALQQELQTVFRQVIDGVLHTNTRVGRVLLRAIVGSRVFSFFINLVSQITAQVPRYHTGDIAEFRAFFELPAEQKLWLRKILPYLDPDHGRVEELGDLMKRVFEIDELLMVSALALALVAHGRERPLDVVPVIAELFDDVMSRSPRGVPAIQHLSGTLYEVLRSQEHIDEETWKLVDHFASAPLDKTKGMLISRAGNEYFCVGFLYPSLLYLEKLGHPGLHLWSRYLKLAVDEEDWDFLGDLLYLAGEIALPYHAPSAALSILRELPPLSDEIAIEKHLDWLTRIRFYHPDLVDDFIDDMEYPEHYLSHVREVTVVEPLMQIVFSRFVSYIIDALRTDSFRDLFTWVLDVAVDCSTVGEWSNLLVRKLTNRIYGTQIFGE